MLCLTRVGDDSVHEGGVGHGGGVGAKAHDGEGVLRAISGRCAPHRWPQPHHSAERRWDPHRTATVDACTTAFVHTSETFVHFEV